MAESRGFVVTGGNAGLGFQCASFLSADRENLIILACVILRAANGLPRRFAATAARSRSLRWTCRAFVDAFRQRRLPPLAGLICNAGGQNIGAPARTAEGYEISIRRQPSGPLSPCETPAAGHGLGRTVSSLCPSGTHDPMQKSGFRDPRYESRIRGRA